MLKLFYKISKEILCVHQFCNFGAMLFIVNLLIKTDSIVVCVPCMLEHVCYEPFFYKVVDLEDILIMLIGLNIVHASKTKQINENLKLNVYARMF